MDPKPALKSALAPNSSELVSKPGSHAGGHFHAREERLEYVQQMLVELRALAAGLDAATLVYLLDMSIIETAEAVKAVRLKAELLSGG